MTAEEIRYLAQALNEQLGGAYVNQTTDLQRPYALRKLRSAMRSGRLLRIPENAVQLQIITGAAALSRFTELEALDFFLGGAVPLPSIQSFAEQAINPRVYFARRAASLFIDDDGLLRTDEEMREQAAQQQEQALLQSTAPELVRQGGAMLQQSMQQPEEAI